MNARGRRCWLLVFGLASLAGACNGTPEVSAPPDLPVASASAEISAAAGGAVALTDGTRVAIPPGALAADTRVTLSRPAPAVFHPEGWLASVRLEPEGLTFATPVEVTIPYDATGVPSADDVVLVHTSTANTQRDVGGETSATELVADVTRVPAQPAQSAQIVARLTHFSLLDVIWVPQLFVAPIIPGRYLRSGDILYSLTGGSNYRQAWLLPMHVGLFIHNATHDGVIESTEPTSGCNPPANGVVDWQGYTGDCGFPSLRGQHLFVGARRPNAQVTVAQGEAAVKTARRWLGSPFGISGFPSPSAGSGVDCVQLAEIAWKGAGVNVTWTPRSLLTPYAQYSNTIPIDTITVKLSEGEVRIPIAVSVRMTDIVSFSLNSFDAAGSGRVGADLTLGIDPSDTTDMPGAGRATLEDPAKLPGATGSFGIQAVKDLVLRPTADDAGLLQHFNLNVAVPSRGFVKDTRHFLNVWIEDDSTEPHPDGDPPCKLGALCDFCETPQAGSAWNGELELVWVTASVLGQFSLEAENPTTHEQIHFNITMSGTGPDTTPLEAALEVSPSRIRGTYVHDPELTAFCCSRYTSADGTRSDIYRAELDLTIKDSHVTGQIVVHTKEGKSATIPVTGCLCPCT